MTEHVVEDDDVGPFGIGLPDLKRTERDSRIVLVIIPVGRLPCSEITRGPYRPALLPRAIMRPVDIIGDEVDLDDIRVGRGEVRPLRTR